jgi:hypothetical protein
VRETSRSYGKSYFSAFIWYVYMTTSLTEKPVLPIPMKVKMDPVRSPNIGPTLAVTWPFFVSRRSKSLSVSSRVVLSNGKVYNYHLFFFKIECAAPCF